VDGLVCANITLAGQRRRRTGGVAALVAAAVVAAGLASRHAPSLAYLAVFPFVLGGAFGVLQARARTCVALARTGRAEVEGGGTRALRDDERGTVQRQARGVLWKSIGIAAAVTLFAVVAGGLTISR